MLDSDILKAFARKNVLVTGGTGMIGRQVVALLEQGEASVRIVSLDNLQVSNSAEHIHGDLSDYQFCLEVCRDMDFVFHIAGIKGSVQITKEKPASSFVPFLMMNTNILEAARRSSVKRILYTSSIGAYRSAEIFKENEYSVLTPPMDYFPGWAKRTAELQIDAYRKQYGSDCFSIVRPCNVYGTGDTFDSEHGMVIPSLMARIRRGDTPLSVWGDGSAVRDFAYSKDVAEGCILALLRGTGEDFFNLGSGIGVSIRELVETLASFLDFEYEFDTSKPAGFPRRVMDISRAKEVLGYNPSTTLAKGLRETWDWFSSHPDEHTRKQNYFRE